MKAVTILCIGAHPDDCEIQCSGAAIKWARNGHRVVFTSVTDGRSGHHLLAPEEIAKLRIRESAHAVEVFGGESINLGMPDGALEPTLSNRSKIIRLVRELAPKIIITNRPNDYHPDHRYTSLLVQDSAYMFMVPHVDAGSPPLEFNPIIMYWRDPFTVPRELRADIAIDIDDVFDSKLEILSRHESQFFTWLPWIERYSDPVPPNSDRGARRTWIREYYQSRYKPPTADRYRDALVARYGYERGKAVEEAEVFEISEYGGQPGDEELSTLFEGM